MDCVKIEIGVVMKKEEILKKVDCLYNMYHEGKLGGEIMPEDENPKLEKSSKQNYSSNIKRFRINNLFRRISKFSR